MRLPILSAALSCAIAGSAAAYVSEPLPDKDGATSSTCRECHMHAPAAADAGALTVEGLPERYVPGARYALTVKLSHPELARAGFEASIRTETGAQAGELIAGDSGLSVIPDPASGAHFVHHTKRGTVTQGPNAAWTFTWNAPAKAMGPVVVRAAANAANGDDSPLGDAILFFSRTIRPN
jgi:hypothetical protein